MNNDVRQGIGRREFIVMTSGTALAAMALGQVPLSAPVSTAGSRSYALGFADSDAFKGVVDGRFVPNVISADRVTSGDGGMLRDGVRVSVRGYNVEPKSPSSCESMELITNYLAPDGQGVLPFIAWSYTKRTGAGNLISFIVPVDVDQRLRLLFSTDLAAASSKPAAALSSSVSRRKLLNVARAESAESGADRDSLTLSLLSGDGLPRLRPGFYILAPLGPGLSEPDWESLQLRQTDNGFKLYAMNGFEPGPARFEYLILRLDLAGKRDRSPQDPSPKKQ